MEPIALNRTTLKRVAIYCRVSTYDQSYDRQERDLTDYAAKAGWEVVGIWKETESGARFDLQERKKVLVLAQRRDIDIVLVTELTRWGRSVTDLLDTLNALHSWGVSVIAQTGFQCDLSTPQGRLIATIMAALAEFERDLMRERIKSGIAAAKARGQKFGREPGVTARIKRLTPKVLEMVDQKQSYRVIARQLGINKDTVSEIVKENRNS